ncbi:Peptide-N4-(N-acetyl-beta-glucosaminyl)asparagine amidase A [Dillenia turbinata]|uniref:Peptide-N4-(N-acetyl-beta-glucosaminyl)asparagine amidase A n=1 Tax=Dillenia turbinata TaxID=194707 RepID=A0AAN8WD98_9MAGN
MAAIHLLLISFFSLLLPSLSSKAIHHRAHLLYTSDLHSQPRSSNHTPLTEYFEVSKPINLPKTKPCSYLVLQHDFGYSYRKPPVLANYTPPENCPSKKFSKIVLEWKSTCRGRQFDRIFGVWLGGVEILRSCTAEPIATGTIWTVVKDITRYDSLLMQNQTLAVYLGNVVDSTYTGIYHVNITIRFYPEEHSLNRFLTSLRNLGHENHHSRANLILPISRNLPLNDGLWFEIENSTDIQVKDFKIPRNVYRAVLEVYVSFHENDESWYYNPPQEYIDANNLTDTPGNGPFREVVVSLDGVVVGAVWPFTVIYTGGFNPLLWRPITGIGSFDLPSYDIEITPFLEKILDGETHEFAFSVTNALNVWYVDANLHLWLDTESKQTEGKLLSSVSVPSLVSVESNFRGLNGTFLMDVSRSIASSGWVKSSHGRVTTHFAQEFNYTNRMVIGNDGDMQIVNQVINFNTTVNFEMPSSQIHFSDLHEKFLIQLYSNNEDQANGTYVLIANITLGFDEDRSSGGNFGVSSSSLRNLQNGHGFILAKGNLVQSGIGSTQQVYDYDGSKSCYFRNENLSVYLHMGSFSYDWELDHLSKHSEKSNSAAVKYTPYTSRSSVSSITAPDDCFPRTLKVKPTTTIPLSAMAVFHLLLVSLFSLLLQSLSTTATLHRAHHLYTSDLLSHAGSLNHTPLTEYFEVSKPINLPKTKPCSYLVLQHDFGYTYKKPPVLANYTPPKNCPSQKFSKIVLEWKSTCRGRQFDRIFGVWLGGVEILRSCTAEPIATGTIWTVAKDITRFDSLLMQDQTLAVYLGNVVDSTYTGIYHVNITINFYPEEHGLKRFSPSLRDLGHGNHHSRANLILPISRNLPLNGGLWFKIENSTDIQVKDFKIPRNVHRAVLEVYVSFHEKDEFWYSNPPQEYIDANNLTDTPGNGPFREVMVSLDGVVVGAVWPFTVIYTGGFNPLLWRPITGIGSFDLPSYDIEITPFLEKILDGETHEFTFSVTNALNVWYVDANLHLWLDSESTQTEGKLLSSISVPSLVSLESNFKGLNGTFSMNVSRSISSSGWVKSSHGTVTTYFAQEFNYTNRMVIGNDGDMQIVNQVINFNTTVNFEMPSSKIHVSNSHKKFLIQLYSNNEDQANGTYALMANVTLGTDEDRSSGGNFGVSSHSRRNLQSGQGFILVKGNLVQSGIGSTQQVYDYDGSKSCYFRNVSSSNYTILYDTIDKSCCKRMKSTWGFRNRRWQNPSHRAFLASEQDVKRLQFRCRRYALDCIGCATYGTFTASQNEED